MPFVGLLMIIRGIPKGLHILITSLIFLYNYKESTLFLGDFSLVKQTGKHCKKDKGNIFSHPLWGTVVG